IAGVCRLFGEGATLFAVHGSELPGGGRFVFDLAAERRSLERRFGGDHSVAGARIFDREAAEIGAAEFAQSGFGGAGVFPFCAKRKVGFEESADRSGFAEIGKAVAQVSDRGANAEAVGGADAVAGKRRARSVFRVAGSVDAGAFVWRRVSGERGGGAE